MIVGLTATRADGLTAALVIFGAFSLNFARSAIAHMTQAQEHDRMSTRRKLGLGIGGVYILGLVLIVAIFGAKRNDNPAFLPADEFKLDPGSTCPARWISTRASCTCSSRRR